MNDRIRRELNKLKRVKQFGIDNPLTPPNAEAEAAFTGVNQSITKLEGLAIDQQDGAGTVKGSVTQRRDLTARLRKAMSALAKAGRTLDRDTYPEVAAKVRTSGLNSYQSYLDRAGVIIETVNPIKQVFIDLGAKETVIEDLQALKDALEAAGASKDSGLDEQIAGTAGLDAEARVARRHVRKLDAILSQLFEDDPGRLAAWKAAKRTQKDPESPEEPALPEPPPGGEGSPG